MTGAVGTIHPDFSGSTIVFGLGQVVTLPPEDAGDSLNVMSTFDNLSFSILSVPTPAVPEPMTWAMCIGGLGMLGLSLRRQQSRQVRYAFA